MTIYAIKHTTNDYNQLNTNIFNKGFSNIEDAENMVLSRLNDLEGVIVKCPSHIMSDDTEKPLYTVYQGYDLTGTYPILHTYTIEEIQV